MSRKGKKTTTKLTVKQGVSDRELQEMREAFRAFDLDGSGKALFNNIFNRKNQR